ncbi:hypothetical protein PG990_009225 [Apiospora arundinis]
MHLTPFLSWTLAVLAVFPSNVLCAEDETITKSDIKTESPSVSATTEGASPPTSSPTSTDSVQDSSNSTEATATTTSSQRPVTTALVVTPTTSVPDLLNKWSNSGASLKDVELVSSLFGLVVAFIV